MRKGIPMLCEWIKDVENMTNEEAGEFLTWCFNNYDKEEYEINTNNEKVKDLCLKAIMLWNECEENGRG